MTAWEEKFKEKLISPEQLEKKIAELRKQGKKIVTLNGSFDLLHAGHLHMIYEARLQGDCLLMALNSDSSIKQYKSPKRPIIPLEYRLQMIAALGFVDYVTWFEEVDPRKLLAKIKPDVHVNGAEYGEDCIEAEVVKKGGGKLHIVPLITGLSTTKILEKIKHFT
ncbi:MAG: adenylyltransferase/cytidyltransferase family protein [Simkania negevensis]|nr:adenylyltransferase/cytidyltransferase family protein [Simkania negevensis]